MKVEKRLLKVRLGLLKHCRELKEGDGRTPQEGPGEAVRILDRTTQRLEAIVREDAA